MEGGGGGWGQGGWRVLPCAAYRSSLSRQLSPAPLPAPRRPLPRGTPAAPHTEHGADPVNIAAEPLYVPSALDCAVPADQAWVHGGFWKTAVRIHAELKCVCTSLARGRDAAGWGGG